MFAKQNYKKSNSILTVNIIPSEETVTLAMELLTNKHCNRQDLSQRLLDALTDLAEIDIVNVTISDTNQYHKKSKGKVVFKQYGYYKPKSRYIYITNKTAVRGQILAPKSFVDTLLHEWLHHYDHQKLGLTSIHSAGFYARLKDIKEKVGYNTY